MHANFSNISLKYRKLLYSTLRNSVCLSFDRYKCKSETRSAYLIYTNIVHCNGMYGLLIRKFAPTRGSSIFLLPTFFLPIFNYNQFSIVFCGGFV